MNTRGLVELIVLNVGLEAKVISPTLFTIMVLMVGSGGGTIYPSCISVIISF